MMVVDRAEPEYLLEISLHSEFCRKFRYLIRAYLLILTVVIPQLMTDRMMPGLENQGWSTCIIDDDYETE